MTRPVDLATERALLVDELLEARRQRRIAEDTFKVITDYYYRRYPGDPTTAEWQAAANFSRKCAQADATWWRDKVLIAAAALTALGGAP